MALRRKRNEQNGVKDGSWGYSQESLAELERGVYGRTTNRKARYNSSSEQTRQAHELPALEGMASKEIWESNYGKNRKSPNTVDSRSARRKYEQRVGHFADDARNLRNQGYNSSHQSFDFSDYDNLIENRHQIDFGIFSNPGMQELADPDGYTKGKGVLPIDTYIKHPELITPEVRQAFINKFGAPISEVIPAYQSYVEEQNRKYAEEHPIRVGLEDIGSAFERGNAATTARIANKIAPNTKISDYFNSDEYLKKVNAAEKKRDYVRGSQNLSESEKNLYNMLYGGGDWLSSSLTGGLLTGGVGVANPETGFALTVQPSKLVKALTEAYTKFGLGRTQEYGNLKRRGVSEEEAQKMADFSGAMAGATAGATAGLGGFGGTSGSALENLAWAFGRSAAVGGVSQTANEFAEKKILDEQSIYELSKQAYITQGLSEEEATKKADADRATRIGGAALINGLVGAGSNLLSQGVSNIKNALVPVENEPLNSVWATQQALPQNDIPQLTGTVDNTQALTGSTYNVPALVDNIYPIQMPGTQGVIPMPGTNGVIAPVIGGESAPVANKVANETAQLTDRVTAKLTGETLKKAETRQAEITTRLGELKTQIAKQSEVAKNAPKTKKNAEYKKLDALKKEQDKLVYEQYALGRQINGLPEISRQERDFITSYKADLKKVGNMYAGKEGKKLAQEAITALEKYESTGNNTDYFDFLKKVYALESAAVNPYTNKGNGKVTTYDTYFKKEDGSSLTEQLVPAEMGKEDPLTFKTLMKMLVPNSSAESAPVDVPVEVNPDDVIYHSGILSRLNKADSAGKMQGSRDTGYYGTGHYFVDQAHKSQIGKGSGYADKPYTSVDISKYNNLFRADTDAKASELHDFSQKMMRYINGRNDRYYTTDGEIDPLAQENYILDMYAEYLDLFPADNHLSLPEFKNRLGQFRDEYEYDFYDRGDSAFTTFMKEHGYNGVDTRGTNSANTERGVVIYDLDEDSILQSNVTDEAVKNGLMNTRVRNGQPLFDEETDARIQNEIDATNKRKQIKQEYRKLYDESKLKKIDKEIEKTKERINRLENDIIPYEQLKADKDPEQFEIEYKQFRRVDPDITKEEFANIFYDNSFEDGDPLVNSKTELALMKGKLEELEKAYASEEKLSEAAYKQAKNTVNGVIPEEDLDAAVAQSVSESLVPEVKNVSAKAKTKKVEAQKANVPAVTNEPNFSLVGGSYTPKEVPNVQPTPPSNNVPPNNVPPGDGPDNGGEMKTSQYYKNTMRGTETNRDMSDEEYAKRFDEEIYKRMTIPEQQSVSMGQRFIDESGSEEAAIQRLLSGDFDSEERFSGYHIDAAEMLANNIERQALELEAQGQDASQLWRTANKLHKKIQLNASDFGVGLQALQKWKKSTPQGAFDDLISQVNKGIDQKKTTGYTRSINSLSDKIVDAVENSDSKAGLIDKIKSIFAEDRKNNPYNTQKAEQQVLDLVGGDKNTKMSITDLADEAGKVIKKQMGVSSLTPKEERAILNLLDAASQLEPGTRAYNELVSQAMIIVDESLPASAGEKFKSLLYDNMLASIKTMFTRNFGGNVVGNAIDAMAAPFQVGADAIVGKFTGERTRTLNGKSIVAAAKGLGHGFKDWGQDIGYSLKNKTLLNTARSGQESLADVLHAVHKTWKTQSNNKAVKGIHNALATYDYIIRKGMEGGDRPIYEAQYAATQAELYHLVKKYGDAGLRKGLPADKRDVDTDDLIDMIAINEALEAVLQNDSKMKEAAKNIKAFFRKASEDMVGIDIASMSHAPFVEVPANMASNFFKLTPVGWVGNINRTIGEKRKYGSINQRRFTGELGLNVLGGLMGAGLFGVANKIISDKYSEDKDEKKLQQNNGYQEYALQAPDESWQADISDIPYLGAMMKYAKMERDAYNEDGLKGALSALGSSIGAATVDTLYQSLNRLTGADFQYNGSGNLVGNAINNIKSSVGSMGVPSWLRQTAQFTDPYKRDLGDYGSDEYNKNLIINGIPGLRQTMLDPKIDTAGQPVPELGGATGFNRFMSAYINPWKISHPHENTSAVQEYANMLKQATEGKVNPQMKVVNKSDITKIKGYDAENYSHKDLRDFQEEYYKSNTEYGNALINDPWFTNLSYEKQGELLDELWKANKALCQENFVRKGKTPEEIEAAGDELYTTDNKLAGILRDDDENHTGLIQWLKDETARDEMNEKYGTNMSHDKFVDFNSRGEGYAEQRASETEIAKSLGMTVDSYEKYEAEYEGGAQAYHDDREAAKQYGFVNANKVANIDAYNVAKELGNGDPNVIQAYSDYKKQGIKSNSYGAKANYLEDEDRLTDQQKGMVIAGSQDGSKIGNLAKGAQELYRMGGDDYSGVYYYYLLKNMADADGSGSVTKKEREAFFANDNPYLDDLWQLNQDMYNYLMTNLK